MAKKEETASVKVRVLVDGEYNGVSARVDDVIELAAEEAKRHAAQSSVDVHSDAVAYAESLKA